jgi:recombination protein RecT
MTTNNTRAIVPAQQKLQTLRGLFDQSKSSLASVMPKHLTPDRLLKITLSAASRTPALLDCTPQSILLAVMQCAQLGLEPNTPLGLAYILPYENRKNGKKEAQFLPGYRGLIKLAQQSGEISDLRSRVVYQGDHFHVEYGLHEKLEHIPSMSGENRENREIVAVYAVATIKGSSTPHMEVMTMNEVVAIKNRSRSGNNGPWVTDLAEMARKTVIRRICKSLPLSVEMVTALAAQATAEAGDAPDYGEFVGVVEPETQPQQLTATDEMKARLAGQVEGEVS